MSNAVIADPPQGTQVSAFMQVLYARFGKEMLDEDFVVIPRRVVNCFERVGMTALEFSFWVVVISHQYGSELPYPGINTIASMMGKSTRTIERYIRSLEKKGLLIVVRGDRNLDGSFIPNRYDFKPLYDKIIAVLSGLTLPPQNGNLLDNNSTSQRETKPVEPIGVSRGDTMSYGSNSEFATKMGPPMSLEESKEECNRFGNSRDSKDTLSLTKMNGKNGHSKQPPPSGESAAAPSAWSNVPQPTEQAALPQEIICFVNDLSVEFGNRLRMKSNVSRARNLYARISRHLDIAGYQQMLHDCAMPVRAMPDVQVKKRNPDNSPNRMPYFFRRLEDRIASFSAGFAREDAVIQQLNDQAAKSTAQSLMMRLLTSDELASVNSLPDDEYWAQVARFMPGGDCYVE